MSRKLTAVAALAVTAAALAAGAAAGPVPGKQRVALEQSRETPASFVLTPLAPGAIKRDTGALTFCCWSSRRIMRDGQSIEINDPQLTLTGKHGTLVLRNRIEWVDIPNSSAIFTGTWKLVRGTGAYAGLAGGGRVGGVTLANGTTTARFEGFLGPK